MTCFSKKGDLLSQWRAYSNHGQGIAIGFDFWKFDKSVDKHVSYRHIDYDENIQKQVIEEHIRIIIEFFSNIKNDIIRCCGDFELPVAMVIIEYLEGIVASYKNERFQNENEFRFEYVINDDVKNKSKSDILFRASNSLIIPYVLLKAKYKKYLEEVEIGKYINCGATPSFALKHLPINEIIIGPSLDYHSIKIAIEALLVKHNYEHVAITKSNVPYRIS